MKSAEQIVFEFNEAVDFFAKESPDSPAAQTAHLDIRAVKAAFRIMEIMQNYPLHNFFGEDLSRPNKWDEHTILMMTGAIMSFYGTEI